MNSNRKGKVGEREWSHFLTERGFGAARGQQFAGSPDSPDVVCHSLAKLHFEVKRVERLNIEDAMEQATIDAGWGKTPVVAHRRNNKGWLVTMRAEDWVRLIRGGYAALLSSETSIDELLVTPAHD